MTHPVSLHPPNSEAVRQTLYSRSCVWTRRNANDAAFMRKLWTDPVFMRSFHRLVSALPVADQKLERILKVEFQNPVTKSRAMHWTVRDPSGRPWGLLSLPGMLMQFHFYFKTNKFNKPSSMVFACAQPAP